MPEPTTRIALGRESLAFSEAEVDRLLAGLGRLGTRDAHAVGDEIAALRLAGGVIRLAPTEAELAAVQCALAREVEPLGPALLRLAGLCVAEAPSDVRP